MISNINELNYIVQNQVTMNLLLGNSYVFQEILVGFGLEIGFDWKKSITIGIKLLLEEN